MAGLFNPSDITFSGKEVQAVSELIIEEVYSKPSLSQIHTPVSGIKAKQQIGYAGRLSGLVGKLSTGCEPTTDTNTIPFTQKFWEPAYIEGRFVQCFKDLLPSFWAWALGNGLQKSDLTKTDFVNFVKEIVGDAVYEAWLRLIWFGNTSAANYNGSPAGVITNGISTTYFTPIDGYWEQIADIVAADSARLSSGLTAKNGQATFALQAFDATDTTNEIATETLAQLKYEADFRLRDKANLMYVVTQSVFDQYAKELRSNANVDASYNRIEGGYTSLMFEGIEVIGVNFFDRMIRAYQSNGTKYNKPHRALLTTKDMLMVGIEEESNLSEFDIFMDKKTKDMYMDFAFNLDAKINQDFMIQTSY